MDTYQEETGLRLSSQEATYCQFTFSPMSEAHLKEKPKPWMIIFEKNRNRLFAIHYKLANWSQEMVVRFFTI